MSTSDSLNCSDATRRTVFVSAPHLVLLALSFLPLLTWMGIRLFHRAHYQFFPLLLAASLSLGYQRLRDTPASASNGWLRRSFAVTTLLLLLLATLFASPLLGLISALVCSLAVVYTLGGGAWLRAWLPIWATLWLMVPPPNNLDLTLIDGLQTLVVQLSGRTLDLLGVVHLRVGHVLEVPGKRLLVDEACSGIHGLFASLAFVLLYTVYLRRSVLTTLYLVIVCVFWVISCNVLRVTLIGYADAQWGTDLSVGWLHTILGLLTFALGLGLILSSERLLWFFLPGLIPDDFSFQVPSPTDSRSIVSIPRHNTWLTSLPCLGLFAVLGVIHAGEWGYRFMSMPKPFAAEVVPALQLPANLAGWKRLDEHPCERFWPMGVHSQAWAFQRGSRVAVLAVDAPLRGYHTLEVCYRNGGWKVDQLSCMQADQSDDGLPRTEAILSRPNGQYGLVLFSLIDESGEWIDPPTNQNTQANYWWMRTLGRFTRRSLEPVSYQMQLFVDQSQPVDEMQSKELRILFTQARNLWLHQLQKKGSVCKPCFAR